MDSEIDFERAKRNAAKHVEAWCAERCSEAGSGSLCSALVLLHARWLEKADAADRECELAATHEHEVVCIVRAQTYRACAADLKDRAGSEANDEAQRLPETAREQRGGGLDV